MSITRSGVEGRPGGLCTVRLRVFRGRPGQRPRYDTFEVRVPKDAYVLDAVESVWREHDRTLIFRHACHHASCGTCGMRIDGRERLACIAPLRDYPERRPITVEPLRHFPLVADLVVDVSGMFARLERTGMPIVRADPAPVHRLPEGIERLTRFENCIECGLCVSACPIAGIDPAYMGPAALAAADRVLQEPRGAEPGCARELATRADGVWRCHNAYECSEVCPQEVDPAGAIRRLRSMTMGKSGPKVGSEREASSDAAGR